MEQRPLRRPRPGCRWVCRQGFDPRPRMGGDPSPAPADRRPAPPSRPGAARRRSRSSPPRSRRGAHPAAGRRLERRRELPRAEHGLPPALASTRPAIEDVEVLALGVVGARFRRHLEMGLDDVIHVHEHRRRPLLALLLDQQVQPADVAAVHRRPDGARRRLAPDLVAPDRLRGDRGEHMDPVDDPCDRRLPVDGLQLPAGGGGCHHGIGLPLDLQLLPGEQRAGAPDTKPDTVHDSVSSKISSV